MFYDCKDCIFATNSKREAMKHALDTNHDIPEEED